MTSCFLTSKLSLNFTEELKILFSHTSKLSTDYSVAKSRFTQIGDDYKKCLKDTQRLQKDNEDKLSKIKQQEVEISHLQDVVSNQKDKLISLTKDDSELSYYRNSANSINSVDLNNEMPV